mmetsp:Transcript_16957/g.28267  ORF Transcript_16957/g.28267 Transcript_16957/m.28267 type:complete len:352 (-) Transcript_16957:170-1225(-)
MDRQALVGVLASALSGALVSAMMWFFLQRRQRIDRAWAQAVLGTRRALPRRIILVRHGESEGNADSSLYRTTADNLIELTDQGVRQAKAVGERIKQLLNDDTCHIIVSPFERTLQTSRNLRLAIEKNVRHTYVEPRIREQEFGNLQGDDFRDFRREQTKIGRFFYRFPTGESGADVYDRTKAWWNDTVIGINLRPGYEPVDALVVVTHGLTMRLILMQLYGWSPNTFSSVWNAGNCAMYVLQLDESEFARGLAPYKLDRTQGDFPASSIDVHVTFKNGQPNRKLTLSDYLSIPAPRTTYIALQSAKEALAQQHGLAADDIDTVDFFYYRAGYSSEEVLPPKKFRSNQEDLL